MNLINRVIRAAMLDVQFFNEVERDNSLNTEALMVVILVSVAAGIGAFLGGVIVNTFGRAFMALFAAIITGVINYYIWSYITYFIGTNLFEGTADPGELLRVLGYASGPRIFSVLSFVPCLGPMLGLVGAVWSLIAGFIGVREALDLDNTKTLVTVIIGWIVIVIINIVIGSILGIGALGLGAITSLV